MNCLWTLILSVGKQEKQCIADISHHDGICIVHWNETIKINF